MSRFDAVTGRALEIAGNVGDSLKGRIPDKAMDWVKTGAALGALKTGSKVAGKFVRRNPVVMVAAAAGAGLILYAVRRHQNKLNGAAIEGKATRVEAKKAAPRKRAASQAAPRKRASKTSAS